MRGKRMRWSRGLTLASAVAAGCMLVSTLGAPVASADTGTGGEPRGLTNVIEPMTPEQIEWRDRKLAIIAQRLGGEAGPTALSAESPEGAVPMAPCEFDPCPDPGAPFERVLDFRPRHQWRYFYCGPATVQALSNYKWGYFVNNQEGGQTTSANKYKQKYINSQWVLATSTGGATIGNLIKGMNQASGTPGFYSQWQNPSWVNFHNAIITDTVTFNVGLAAGVNPRKTGSAYYLFSWRNVSKGDYGHYIALNGYTGDAQSSAIAWYHDSSGGVDQETGEIILGSTGLFNDLSYTVYQTMKNRYGNLAW